MCVLSNRSLEYPFERSTMRTQAPRSIRAGSVLTILVALGWFSAGARAVNHVRDPGFEEGMRGWNWGAEPGVNATGRLDRDVRHRGAQAFRMTNATPRAAHKYGKLYQKITGLKPSTVYRIGAWFRGADAGTVWIGGGPGWRLRCFAPRGDFEWQWVTGEYTTGRKETEFALVICTESPSRAVWVDDVMVAERDSLTTPIVRRPASRKELPAAAALYAALPTKWPRPATVVHIYSADKRYGAGVRITWDAEALRMGIDVRQATRGPVIEGPNMWKADSVQIALDTRPGLHDRNYTAYCYELAFAMRDDGTVVHSCLQSGAQTQFDWSKVTARAAATKEGYRLDLAFRWESLDLSPAKPPAAIGVNVLINEHSPGRGRRFVEWTPGTGHVKRPGAFARVYLVDGHTPPSVARIVLPKVRHDDASWISARYTEHAVRDLPPATLHMTARPDVAAAVTLFTRTLPAAKAGRTRDLTFTMPARLLEAGRYTLTADVSRAGEKALSLATADLVRMDIVAETRKQLAEVRAQVEDVERLLAAHPTIVGDVYVNMGMYIARRFIKRLKDGGANGVVDTSAWRWLEVRETRQVLDKTRRRIGRLAGSGRGATLVSRPTGGRATVKDGVFYTDTALRKGGPVTNRPYFFYGYNGWRRLTDDYPNFWTLGVTAAQQERGPMQVLNRALKPNRANAAAGGMIRAAHRHRMKVDFLLAPHYFPAWLYASVPETRGQFSGLRIDHPKVRNVLRRFLDNLLPVIRREPGLLSICLSNEPRYRAGGRDKYSRPAWITYLKSRHKTIAALNACYGTSHENFQQVPLPPPEKPAGARARRAHWDWVRFNQFHLAAFHRWMHEICKSHAPRVPTHAKVVPLILGEWGKGDITWGVDPELITEITDLAGNDCESVPTPGGPYAHRWQMEQLYYDLLHSFGGKVVFNSENHLIPGDRRPEQYPPDHTRAVLWQGGLHHQGATTIWVWEDGLAAPSLRGGIYRRPANMYAAGQAMFDLNRLSVEVAALSNAPARVAMLYSVPCFYWQNAYYPTMKNIYAALSFLGQRVTFISERQLAAGTRGDVDWIILPRATHVTDRTVEALGSHVARGGKVIAAGADFLSRDEHDRPRKRPPVFRSVTVLDVRGDDRVVTNTLRPVLLAGGLPIVKLIDAGTGGRPAFGVEYRTVAHKGRTLVAMMNHMIHEQTVSLALQGTAVDRVSESPVDPGRIRLRPIEPVLLEIKR